MGAAPKAIIERGQYLVHSLHVHDAWVQPRVQEQDAAHDVSVGEDVVLLEVAIEVTFAVFGLLFELVFEVAVRFVEGIGKELHVVARSPDILLNLSPNNVVDEVLVPEALWFDAERVVVIVVLVVVFGVVQVRNDDQVFFEAVIYFLVLLHH